MNESLRHLFSQSVTIKVVGLGLLWIAMILLVYDCSMNPRSAPRRMAVEYVGWLDAQFKSMLKTPRGAFIAWSQGCAAISLSILTLWFASSSAFAGVFAVLLVPPGLVRFLVSRRLIRLQNQVHGFALALANSLKTTASIGDAFGLTACITSAPLREEIEIALKEVKVGSTIQDALLSMSARAKSTALDTVVSAVLIGRQTGGDLPRILEGTAASLRELQRLEEMTHAVNREGKLALGGSALITLLLPVGMHMMMPTFMAPVFHTAKGQAFLLQCAVGFLFALFLGYRFTRTDV
jgi:tight adherence protein B